jgi:hypothetical protein
MSDKCGGGLTGAGTDLGHAAARADVSELGKAAEQFSGIPWASPVVEIRVLPKSQSQIVRGHITSILFRRRRDAVDFSRA